MSDGRLEEGPFAGDVLVERVELRTKKNGDPYTALDVRTLAGQMVSAKYWDGALQGVDAGTVVRLEGSVREWQGRPDLAINRVGEASEGRSPREFLPRSSFDPEERLDTILSLVEQHTTDEVQTVVRHLLEKHREAFCAAPGGVRMHHARVGGLAEHVLDVLRLSLDTVLTLADLGHDVGSLSRDAIVGGAAIHDIGKIREYVYGDRLDYDDDGRTVGHLAMGHHMLISAVKELELPYTDALKHVGHIILSHHGKLEWGSPVEPMTVEALIVHRADLLSKDLDIGLEILRNAAGEEKWSSRDNRLFNISKTLRRF